MKPERKRKAAAQKEPGPTRNLADLHAVSHVHLLDSAVDRLVREWDSVVPTLDKDVRAIVARVARIDDRMRSMTAIILKEAGLSDNEFRLLAALLRIGKPHRASPTDIAGHYVPVTSGGLTGLARRLESRKLIKRVSHPSDQRSLLIELTQGGYELAFDTMKKVADVEQALMKKLTQQDLRRGNVFLQKLLHSIEAALP